MVNIKQNPVNAVCERLLIGQKHQENSDPEFQNWFLDIEIKIELLGKTLYLRNKSRLDFNAMHSFWVTKVIPYE